MNVRKRYKLPIARKGEYPNGNLIQVIDDESLDAIVRNTMGSLQKTGKVLADFDHYSELSSDIKKALDGLGVQLPTMASGWISNVYREGDAVYGDMVSTPEGEKAIETETYCKTSPTFRLIDCSYIGQRGGKRLVRPLKVKSVALCNKPNMENLGAILNNREIIENKEDDLQNVMLGSAMDILGKGIIMSETKDETIVTNAVATEAPAQEAIVANAEPAKPFEDSGEAKPVEAPTVEEVKEAVLQDVNGQVGIIAESQGLDPEKAQVVADVAVEAVADGVEAVEEAVVSATPVASTIASGEALEKANAEIERLTAKIKELTDARDAEALQNRINAELAKYPTLQNRAESEALLKLDWDLGVKFLASIKPALVQKTIQNRVPTKAPDVDFGKMTVHERVRYKMLGR